jgi:2-(3-amino-3-carboxypropyl)histidine synthase
MAKKIDEIQKKYDLELGKAIAEIKKIKKKNKKVLLQFPEGLKPFAPEIADYLREKTDADIFIWLGACFGACDIPQTDADLTIQFGHAPWK